MGKTKRDQKRRDKKGRILRNGESQRKDGRYAFVYTDCYGKQKFLYSWKLEPTDSLPTGCRPCLALREKEKNIQRDLHDGIVPYGGNLTVLDLVQKYIGQKKGVRHNTQANYDFVINIIKKGEFGTRRIDKIKLSDAKAWFIKLQADGRGYSSIHSVRGIVRPAFQMAVEDDLLRKNPFEFQLCTVVVNDSVTRQAITKEQEELFLEFIRNDDHYSKYYNGMFILFKTGLRISEFCGLTVKDIDLLEFQLCTVVVNDSVTRQAITKEQEELFLEFIRNDDHYSKYYNGMFILFKTGLRISEFCGLTVKDIDLQERKINVNHQLQRTRGMQYVIEDTKTSSGTRMLPMTDEVYECFEQIVKNRKKVRVEPIIDGYSRFLFLDKKDMPEVALHWEKHFQWALGKYNRTHEEQMPKITPHVCRHTYCSNMAKAGMNPKALQYLMGHSDIGVTLNVYTHLGLIDAKEEMNRIAKLA